MPGHAGRCKADVCSTIDTQRAIGRTHLERHHVHGVCKASCSDLPITVDDQGTAYLANRRRRFFAIGRSEHARSSATLRPPLVATSRRSLHDPSRLPYGPRPYPTATGPVSPEESGVHDREDCRTRAYASPSERTAAAVNARARSIVRNLYPRSCRRCSMTLSPLRRCALYRNGMRSACKAP